MKKLILINAIIILASAVIENRRLSSGMNISDTTASGPFLFWSQLCSVLKKVEAIRCSYLGGLGMIKFTSVAAIFVTMFGASASFAADLTCTSGKKVEITFFSDGHVMKQVSVRFQNELPLTGVCSKGTGIDKGLGAEVATCSLATENDLSYRVRLLNWRGEMHAGIMPIKAGLGSVEAITDKCF